MHPAADPPLPLAGAYDRPASWLGQRTAQVLGGELGVSRAELEELTQAGIVRDKHPEAKP